LPSSGRCLCLVLISLFWIRFCLRQAVAFVVLSHRFVSLLYVSLSRCWKGGTCRRPWFGWWTEEPYLPLRRAPPYKRGGCFLDLSRQGCRKLTLLPRTYSAFVRPLFCLVVLSHCLPTSSCCFCLRQAAVLSHRFVVVLSHRFVTLFVSSSYLIVLDSVLPSSGRRFLTWPSRLENSTLGSARSFQSESSQAVCQLGSARLENSSLARITPRVGLSMHSSGGLCVTPPCDVYLT
jgi:hypothetical protein